MKPITSTEHFRRAIGLLTMATREAPSKAFQTGVEAVVNKHFERRHDNAYTAGSAEADAFDMGVEKALAMYDRVALMLIGQ